MTSTLIVSAAIDSIAWTVPRGAVMTWLDYGQAHESGVIDLD
jgi:hypothetical protein